MLIRFCGGRGVSPTWKTGDAKVEAAGVAGGSGINILSVMVPPVFDPIREPAPVSRVGGDIPTLTRPDASPDQTYSQLRDLTTMQDQPHFTVFVQMRMCCDFPTR
jgi:hypothetical protein